MQLKYLSLVPLLLLGVVLGALLIPREVELGLMSFKANRFPAAEPIYADRREQGDLSVGTIFPLTQIYLNDGRVDAAIEILEELIAAQPDDLEALQLVGKLYSDAQRLDDYARNLERLNALSPAEGQLHELIDIYDRDGAFDEEITALQSLVSTYGGTPRDFHQLATLLADDGKLEDAAVVLQAVAVNQPDWLDVDMRTLLFRLLLDTDATPAATDLAIAWVTAGVSREEVQYLTSEMLGRGNVDEASAIFAPFMAAAANDPLLQPLLLSLLMARGEIDKTVALLADWHAQGLLTAETLTQYISIALASGAIELAEVLTAGEGLPALSADLLVQIVDDAYGQEAFTVVAGAGDQFVDADLVQRPLVGAKVAVANGDLESAALWAEVALRGPSASIAAAIELAEILILLDDKPAALSLLNGLAGQSGTPAEAYQMLARLYVDLDRMEDGFSLFSDLRAGAADDLSGPGWALLAAHTGRSDLVLDWLAGRPRIHADNLEDIVAAAQATGADGLALAAAEHLFALKDGPQERLLLAEALLRMDQPGPALAHLRPIVTTLPEAEPAFVKALQGVGANDELATFLAVKDQNTAGGLAQTDLIDDLLVSDGVPTYLLPFVERLARETGGDWLYTYAELAQRAQQTARLVSFLEAELKRSTITPAAAEEQLSILAQVSPDRALRTVEQLAQQAPQRWSALYIDLLQAAGDAQRMQAAIESRLASGGASAEVEALAFALIDSGDVAASLSAARLLAQEQGGDWLFTYAEIATQAGRQAELASFLVTEVQRPDLTPADVAERVDLLISAAPDQAVAALEPLVGTDPTRWFVPYFELLQQRGDVAGVTRLIEQRLAAGDVPAAQIEALSYSLVAAADADAALPTVRRMAETLGGDWVFTYVDLAQRANRNGDAINFVNHELNRQDLSKAEFEDLVSLLIAIDPVPAVAILKHRAGVDGGLWYEAYTEALLTVPPRERGLASSRKAMAFLASSVGGPWLRAYAEKARADNQQAEFVEFLNQQRDRADLEPANADIIAEMWSAL